MCSPSRVRWVEYEGIVTRHCVQRAARVHKGVRELAGVTAGEYHTCEEDNEEWASAVWIEHRGRRGGSERGDSKQE